MDIDFLFKEEFALCVRVRTKFCGDKDITRALYLPLYDKAVLNLSADQWKVYKLFGDDILIKGITDTITHETLHKALEDVRSSVPKIPKEGEEMMVQRLVGLSNEE